jgi:hypothetical protein
MKKKQNTILLSTFLMLLFAPLSARELPSSGRLADIRNPTVNIAVCLSAGLLPSDALLQQNDRTVLFEWGDEEAGTGGSGIEGNEGTENEYGFNDAPVQEGVYSLFALVLLYGIFYRIKFNLSSNNKV